MVFRHTEKKKHREGGMGVLSSPTRKDDGYDDGMHDHSMKKIGPILRHAFHDAKMFWWNGRLIRSRSGKQQTLGDYVCYRSTHDDDNARVRSAWTTVGSKD